MKFLLFALAANAARFLTVDEPIDGQYIVVFKKQLPTKTMDAHKEVAALKNIQINRQYSIGDQFNGYAASMSQDALNYLLDQPEIDYVEQDGMAHASYSADCTTQDSATWGLVRTSQIELNINGKYQYQEDGGGAYAFVLDTGIYIQHNDFNGRASWGANFVDSDNSDKNGHGTHCAGTIGGTKYGLAKACRLVAVKVLDASGSGAWSGVISGVEFVVKDIRRPATINLSLGGGKTQSVNDAVDAATTFGVIVVAAAGNSNADTCNFSPASAKSAIAVGATNNLDQRATFSNHGTCMTLFAPGQSITSTWIGNVNADNTISGTSMAAPHVVGVVTKYLAQNPKATPALVKEWVTQTASGNLVKSVPLNTPNLLLYDGCIQSSVNATTVKLTKRY
jgi:serine protease